MAADVIRINTGIDVQKLNVIRQIRSVMVAGHALHIYQLGNNEASAVSILESYESMYSPLVRERGYGQSRFGVDRAIVRALYTYSHAKRAKFKNPRDYAESRFGHIEPSLKDTTKLDMILEVSPQDGIVVHPVGREVIARTTVGGGEIGSEPLEISSSTALGAIYELTETFNFRGLSLDKLPDGTDINDLPSTLLGQ